MNEKFSFIRYRLKRINREEAAFTLLEVLLALTLTGILLVLISPAFSNLSRFLFRAYDTAELSRTQRLLYRKIAETLDNAYCYPYFDDRIPGFTGDEKGFKVPVVTQDGLGQAEFQLQGEELIFKWSCWQRPNLKPEEIGKEETWILTNQLVTPSFSYLDGRSGVWRSVWDEEYYPRLVRFTSSFRHRNGRETILVPLVFPIRIGQDDGR